MFSLACNLTKNNVEFSSKNLGANNVDFSIVKITWNKVSENHVDFLTREITLKNVCGNNVDFSTIKITSKKVREITEFSDHRNFMLKNTWRQHGFFDQQNYVEKST